MRKIFTCMALLAVGCLVSLGTYAQCTGPTLSVNSTTIELSSTSGTSPLFRGADGSTSPNSSCDCPSGYVATGYDVDWNSFTSKINRFRLRCNQLLTNGTLGGTSFSCYNGNQSQDQEIQNIIPIFPIGTFDVSTSGVAPPNFALTGMQLWTAPGVNNYTDGITVIQGQVTSVGNILAGNNNSISITLAQAGVPNYYVGSYGFSGIFKQAMWFAPNGFVITGMELRASNYADEVRFKYADILTVTNLHPNYYGDIAPLGVCGSPGSSAVQGYVNNIGFGEHAGIPVTSGTTYRLSNCGGGGFDSELTVYTFTSDGTAFPGNSSVLAFNDNNGTDCSGIEASLDFVAPGNGRVIVQLNRDNCQSWNGSSTVLSIVEVDTDAPNAVCQNITRNLSATGAATITTGDVDNGSSDNCGIANISINNSFFDCLDVGSNTVTLTVSDAEGNVSTCNSTVTINDNTAPTALCNNFSVDLGAGGSASITVADVDGGTSDACGIQFISISQQNFTCADRGVNNITLTATDVNGNTSTCVAQVDVNDNIPPVAVCNDLTVQLDASGNASWTIADLDGGSTDQCGITNTGATSLTADCSNVGTNTVTLTVSDGDQADQCTSQITVEDNIPPTLVCQDITVQLDASGSASANVFVTGALVSRSDNCAVQGGVGVTGPSSLSCSNIGTFNRTIFQNDVNGNTTTCVFATTVEDNIAPTMVCQDITVQLDAVGNASITTSDVDGGSSDNCAISSLSVTPSSFTCANLGGNTVTLTGTDASGNSASCTAIVTVEDNQAPTAICQDVTVQLDASGNGSITTADVDNGSNDNCSFSLSLSQTAFTCSNVGSNTVTLTVTDAGGNTATCTSNVTVEDNIPPTLVCQDITVQLDASGSASANVFVTGALVSRSDNCAVQGGVGVTGPSSLSCANLGTFNRTIFQNDVNGNTTTCVFATTVEDNIAPVMICQDVTVQLDASGNGSITTADVDGGSSDNCGITTLTVVPNSFNCTDIGSTSSVLTGTDASGNSATCTSVVTVEDNGAPNAVCQDITIQLDASGNATITAADVDGGSNDACGTPTLSASPTSFGCSNVGANTVTLTVTDNQSNSSTCTATVTVQDNINPTLGPCPADIVTSAIPLNCSQILTWVPPTFSDNCPGATLTATFPLNAVGFTLLPVGTFVNTYTATDANGNTSSCSFNITITDNENPTITGCPVGTVTGGTDPGQCGGRVTWGPVTASDNCPGVLLTSTSNSGDFFPVGTTAVSYTATDASGNTATCSFNVQVDDTEDPVIDPCPADQTLTNDAGVCGAVATFTTPGATDNCPGVTVSLTAGLASGSTFPVGTTTNTFTATDGAGNTDNCSFTVTVTDDEAPTAVCQDITVQLDASGQATIVPADVDGGSTDNCGVTSLSFTGGPSALLLCANVGQANNIQLVAFDAAGNSDTCIANIDVQDNVAPNAVCADVTIQLDAAGNGSITANDVDGGSTDACGVASLSVAPSSFTCAEVGANTVTLTVTDVNGNSSTCTATVTVEDNVPPVAVCQDITIQLDAAGNASITGADIDGGSTDACGIASLAASPNSFTCSDVGSNTSTLTVTDNNGNSSTCTSTVTVEDNVAPNAVCQDITVQLDASGNTSITGADVDGGSNDACGIASLSVAPNAFTCAEVGANTVTLTVTDNNGNASTCTATVTVEDNVPPVAICQDITVQLDASGNATITASDVDNGSNDACGIASLAIDINSFDCNDISGGTPTASTLIISEYVEGSGNNKYVEIFNGTGAPVDLADYSLQLFSNGSATPTTTSGLGGILNNGDVAVFRNTSATIYGGPTTSAGAVNFNGDDALALVNDVTLTIQDIFGEIGNDPGSQWSVGGNSTQNNTLRRLGTVTSGVTTLNVGFPTLGTEWTELPINDVSGLGSHSLVGGGASNVVTLTVTDNNGNTSTCTSNVTVEDNIAPVAVCQDITIQLDNVGNAGIAGADVDGGSTDACGIASLSVTPDQFGCADVGANTVTLTVTDVNGNSSTCNAQVTVEDNVAPIALCQDITVQLDATGNATITPTDVDAGSNDACGIASLALDNTAFTCADVGNLPSTTVTPIAGTSFEVPTAGGFYTDVNGAGNVDHDLINNGGGEAPVDAAAGGGEIGFDATYVNTRNSSGLTDGDFVGVTTFTGVVGAFTDGSQGYQMSDTDGEMVLTFDNVNVGGATNPVVSIDYFVQNTGYESDDNLTITVIVDGSPTDIVNIGEPGLEAAGTAGTWQTATLNVAGATNVQVVLRFDGNSSSEAVYFDDLRIEDVVSTSGNIVTLTVTDNNGNSSTCTANVTVEDNVAPNAVCMDITVDLDATGNASIDSNAVDGGSTDACGIASITVTPNTFTCAEIGANTVTQTVTDVNGNSSTCTAVVTVEDNVPPVISGCPADINVGNLLDNCNQVVTWTAPTATDNCGTATVAQTGGPTLNTFGFAILNVGNYTVEYTATDAQGNTSLCTFTITVADTQAPVVNCPADIVVNVTDPANCNAPVTWAAPIANDNCNVNSLTSTHVSGSSFPLGTTTVTYTATDDAGNSGTCSFDVTVNAQPISITGTTTDVSCNGDADGAIDITVSGGCTPYTYAWSNGATTEDLSGLTAGTYDVTVTGAGGQTATASFTVNEPAALSVTLTPSMFACGFNISCNGAMDGSVTATVNGGTPPYMFSWNTGSTSSSITNAGSGTYTVMVTDANGCDTTVSITLVEPDAVVATAVATSNFNGFNISCNGASDGTVDLTVTGGCAPYTYAWSNGATTEDLTGLAAGTYDVTITDQNGCMTTTSVTLTEPTLLETRTRVVSNYNGQDISCNGAADARFGVNTQGGVPPYSYLWSNGATADRQMNQGPGTYVVTVTDANGCTSVDSVIVTEPDTICWTIEIITQQVYNGADVTCYGDQNAWIDLIPCGGTPFTGPHPCPYLTTWSNGATSEDLANVGAGTYTVTITDANGCTAVASVTVSNPDSIAIGATVTDDSCTTLSGAIDLNVTGGTGNLTYLWSTGATTEDLSGLGGGTYSVTVTDQNGCTATATFTVADPCVPVAPPVNPGIQASSNGGNGSSLNKSGEEKAENTISTSDFAGFDIKAYPNPFANDVTIEYTAPEQGSKVSIVVINNIGQVVYHDDFVSEAVGTANKELNFEGISSGVYYVTITSGDNKETLKVIKQ